MFSVPFSGLSRRALMVGGAAAIATALAPAVRAEPALGALLARTHVHGLAVDAEAPNRLLIATHHGLHALDIDSGVTVQVSGQSDDFMGFAAHPTQPGGFLASGHPERGGNLGVISSSDGGASWTRLSDGVDGPVDFHLMDISKADPAVVWGNHGGLQRSRDGGRSWNRVTRAPAGLIDIAASARDPERLYAATETGLFVSAAGATGWRRVHPAEAPVSFVEVTAQGMIYAFILGEGLVRRPEDGGDWEQLHPGFEGRYLLHFAVDPQAPGRVFAATQMGEIIASEDGGRGWHLLGRK